MAFQLAELRKLTRWIHPRAIQDGRKKFLSRSCRPKLKHRAKLQSPYGLRTIARCPPLDSSPGDPDFRAPGNQSDQSPETNGETTTRKPHILYQSSGMNLEWKLQRASLDESSNEPPRRTRMISLEAFFSSPSLSLGS